MTDPIPEAASAGLSYGRFLVMAAADRIRAEHARAVYDCDAPSFEARVDDDGRRRVVCTSCSYTMLAYGGGDD